MGDESIDYFQFLLPTICPYCFISSTFSWSSFVNVLITTFLIDLQGVNFVQAFQGSVWIYLYIYGTFRSFSIRKFGLKKVAMYVLMGFVLIPVKMMIEITAVFWGVMTPKHKFFVVKKDVTQMV